MTGKNPKGLGINTKRDGKLQTKTQIDENAWKSPIGGRKERRYCKSKEIYNRRREKTSILPSLCNIHL